ncbi:MAG TPA: NAD(P)-dependent oxidoreductase [Isosphaeraceae bacterium]|jgi:siroheme synthase-like protein|nr:NAD(P)-dependent oxidoreductase [Isosphaeraceae bacterium]
MPGYPIELDLIGQRVLVVGLGVVGRRKARGLLAAGARVLGVDPRANDIEAPEGIEARAEDYRAEHLQGMRLAIAAATREVNRRVVADAKGFGIWVNTATEPGAGEFRLPAVWRDGPLTLTVATGGASPALAARLRDRAARALGSEAAVLAGVLAELRPIALARVADPEHRRRCLERWAGPRGLRLCAEQGPAAVREAILREIDSIK